MRKVFIAILFCMLTISDVGFAQTEFWYSNDQNTAQLNTAYSFSKMIYQQKEINNGSFKFEEEKPPLLPSQIAVEFLLGSVGSLVGGIPLFALLQDHGRKVKGDSGYSPTANVAMLIGSVVGNSLGVFVVGSSGNVKGSFPKTIIGTSIASLPLLFAYDDPYFPYAAVTLGVLLQNLGSIIGFNVSRSYEYPPQQGSSLINIQNGQLNLTILAFTF